ncbi:D-aminoacylase [Opitutus sp. ER46]|uniref:N-acyl-D-amino-acid deacylase family protein n=1 Tax=Opitutus sp. ER46 TaxID=2161864 RepID=UPI001304AFBF|nr:D-aminoacylase [Opitutus sp. ER46]
MKGLQVKQVRRERQLRVATPRALAAPAGCGSFPAMARVLLLLLLSFTLARAQDYDVVIRHARLVDGTGAPARAGDLAIKDGRIAAVGSVPGRGRTEIEAHGRVLAPGFIDVHTHAEDACELPQAENFLRMGVTTIITGNCGDSQPDIGRFFAELKTTPVAVNVASLVGHGTIRQAVMGKDAARPATPAEIAAMARQVEQAMQAGALGLSTGLIYVPGSFAKTEEIVALAKVVAAHGGLYASHMRHENVMIRAALDEVFTVAREAHVPVQISHLKLSGPAAWGQAADILALLDRQRAAGITVAQDVYVYTAASTSLGSVIDPAVRAGGTATFRRQIVDPAVHAHVVADMKASIRQGKRGDYAYAVIARCESDPRLNGKSVPEAARLLRGNDTLDDQIETILAIQAAGGASAVFHGMSEADVRAFLVHPLTMIGSDSGIRKFGEGVPHPRGYGNNARVLAHYVRELHLLSLEEAVRKMTSLPAHTFHLGQRGELRPGFVADLVLFDPANVATAAEFTDPHHYAQGFDDVFVNGVAVIREGALTAARPGQPVKRG